MENAVEKPTFYIILKLSPAISFIGFRQLIMGAFLQRLDLCIDEKERMYNVGDISSIGCATTKHTIGVLTPRGPPTRCLSCHSAPPSAAFCPSPSVFIFSVRV